MEDPQIPGPSRVARKAGRVELSDQIIALQRKNAAGILNVGPARAGPSRRSEASRAGDGGSGNLSRAEANTRFDDDYNRGPSSASTSTRGRLYDPARSTLPRRVDPPPPLKRADSDSEFERNVVNQRRARAPEHSATGPTRRGEPGKKLFDPMIHDPANFRARSNPSDSMHGSHSHTHGQNAQAGPSRLVLRRPALDDQTPEQIADKERERRRRREGSERGSASASASTGKKRDGDGRSRGSRSSEGSESFKDRERGKGKPDNGIMIVLKEKYKGVTSLEQTLTEMHRKMAANPEAGISVLLDKPVDTYSREIRSTQDDAVAWMELISTHKQLADAHQEFLILALDPLIPSSLHNLPIKYNIPVRLWQTGFHVLLERLRHAWMSNHPAALDLLTDFIYDAYRFYTQLLDDPILSTFRTAWIEALGDLARYRMAIATHLSVEVPKPAKMSRIDDDPQEMDGVGHSGASIGAEVAESWDVEDKETWRTTARDWYAMGISEKPGEGRLHHHLALLCRDRRGEESRALYHFAKSLTASHPFDSSRESILPLFDSALQSQRSLPEATALDLFVRLHGMLFTKISLDDFPAVMSRYMERLEEDASLDGVSRKARITQVDWMMMAIANLSAILQYGIEGGVIRKGFSAEGMARKKANVEVEEGDGVDVEGDENGENDSDVEEKKPESQFDSPPPPTYTFALQLAFSVLEFVLSHPYRIQGIHQVLNPYIPIFLTFLATSLRQGAVAALLDSSIPWEGLIAFFNTHYAKLDIRAESRLVGGISLPEDWTIRGMEWVGRRVYERGFWGKGKSNSGGGGGGRSSGSGGPAQPRIGERFNSEMDVLEADFDGSVDISEGVVDEVEGTDLTDGPVAVGLRRWKRVGWAGGVMVRYIEGLEVEDGKVVIGGILRERLDDAKEKMEREKKRLEEVEEERRRLRILSIKDTNRLSDDESDDEEILDAKDRRKQPQPTLNGSGKISFKSSAYRSGRPRPVQGYTMLIFDTNVLLKSLSLFTKIVERGQWSVIVPLPVVTELDGISKQPPPLGQTAQKAVIYLEKHIRTHSLCLKIQTSKGNYLSDLLIRTETLNFSPSSNGSVADETRARNMDDMILNIAAFQDEHFVDRSGMLGGGGGGGGGGGSGGYVNGGSVGGASGVNGGRMKVLLITFDRNMRSKARSRGIDAADEKELSELIGV